MSAVLGLGTATALPGYGYGPSPSPAELVAVLTTALVSGVRYVDTAVVYGPGEELVGSVAKAIEANGARVCTKLPAPELAAGLAASLGRLRCRQVDTILVHSVKADELADPGLGATISVPKTRGQARRTGASTYGPTEAITAIGQPWCDTLQIEHSLLNPSVVRGLLPHKRPGQELVARSVLCKGLLTERRRFLPEPFAPMVSRVDELEEVARRWGFSLPELAIRYALDTPGVDVVLVGLSSRPELDIALRAWWRGPLTPDQMSQLLGFDHSDDDFSHPERWPVGAGAPR